MNGCRSGVLTSVWSQYLVNLFGSARSDITTFSNAQHSQSRMAPSRIHSQVFTRVVNRLNAATAGVEVPFTHRVIRNPFYAFNDFPMKRKDF